MEKLIFKIIVLGLLVVAVVSHFFDPLFTERKKSYDSKRDYETVEGKVDIAIFGSSHGMNAIDPRLLELKTNALAQNFSREGQKLLSAQPMIEEVLKENELQLAIVDLFYGSISRIGDEDQAGRDFQYNTMDYVDFSIEKVKAQAAIHGPSKVMEVFPTVRRHSYWPEAIDSKNRFILYDGLDAYGGYYTEFKFDQNQWERSVRHHTSEGGKQGEVSEAEFELSSREKHQIDQLIETFQDAEVPLLVISCPNNSHLRNPQYLKWHRGMMNYLQEKQVKILDFNGAWEKEHLTESDFMDIGHLNMHGAEKLSSYLAEYIAENYKITPSDGIENRLAKNRYYLLSDKKAEFLYHEAFEDSLIQDFYGINKMYLYRSNPQRLELLFEGDPSMMQGQRIRIEFKFDPLELQKAEQLPGINTTSDSTGYRIIQVVNTLDYLGKKYSIVPIMNNFDALMEVKFILVKNNKRFLLKEIEKIDIHHADR